MEYIKKFLESNYDKKRKWKPIYVTDDSKGLAVLSNCKETRSDQLKQMITDAWHIVSTHGMYGQYNKIYFNVPVFDPQDKLVYILMEELMHYLINECGFEVYFGINTFSGNINTQGFPETVLGKIAQDDLSKDAFNKEHDFSISATHYRRVIRADGDLMDTSNMLSEIKSFLLRFGMPNEFKTTCAKIITELADNAKEHGKADCLVDIDVTDSNYHFQSETSDDNNDTFYGLNVVVLNFSDRELNHDVKDKIKNHRFNDSERYDKVLEAYGNHKSHFNKTYTEEDFFNIAAFQERISGRGAETKSGGTGLAELIRSLQEYAYDDYCYVMTGDKGIFFKKEYLNFDENNWVGFNEQSNFITDIPNIDSIFRSCAYLPGTGYNFMFVFKE